MRPPSSEVPQASLGELHCNSPWAFCLTSLRWSSPNDLARHQMSPQAIQRNQVSCRENAHASPGAPARNCVAGIAGAPIRHAASRGVRRTRNSRACAAVVRVRLGSSDASEVAGIASALARHAASSGVRRTRTSCACASVVRVRLGSSNASAVAGIVGAHARHAASSDVRRTRSNVITSNPEVAYRSCSRRRACPEALR